MAACKSSLDEFGLVKIASTDLPITYQLLNPPQGVSIAEVEFFPTGNNKADTYQVTNGQSFTIPVLPKATTGRLFVRIVGNYPAGNPIYLVENCDTQTRIMAITDRIAKYSSASVETT